MAGSSQPPTSEAIQTTTTSSDATPVTPALSRGFTAVIALQSVSRSTTLTPSTCMGPILVHLFQLSTINPPVDSPILYVGTQLAGSTRALQLPPGFMMPWGGITGVDIDIAVSGEFGGSPLNIHPLIQHSATASPSSHHSGGKMCRMVWDILHKLKNVRLGVHFPAAFWEWVPASGTAPLCEED